MHFPAQNASILSLALFKAGCVVTQGCYCPITCILALSPRGHLAGVEIFSRPSFNTGRLMTSCLELHRTTQYKLVGHRWYSFNDVFCSVVASYAPCRYTPYIRRGTGASIQTPCLSHIRYKYLEIDAQNLMPLHQSKDSSVKRLSVTRAIPIQILHHAFGFHAKVDTDVRRFQPELGTIGYLETCAKWIFGTTLWT